MTSKRTFYQRLDKLHAILKALKPRQYNHTRYIVPGTLTPPATCGTVGCALGHAVVSKQFKNIGIYWDGSDLTLANDDGDAFGQAVANRADEFFGPEAYDTIFDSSAYDIWSGDVKRSMVLKRIREFTLRTTGYHIIA
jgi:hypothetical protein